MGSEGTDPRNHRKVTEESKTADTVQNAGVESKKEHGKESERKYDEAAPGVDARSKAQSGKWSRLALITLSRNRQNRAMMSMMLSRITVKED